MLVNILKHLMIGDWLPQVMTKYKADAFTFTVSGVDYIEVTYAVPVLNDDNVNRLFGWDV